MGAFIRFRFVAVGLVALLALVALAAGPAAAAPTDRKADDKFLVFTFADSFTIPAGEACAFAVVQHFEGFVKVRLIDRAGTTQVAAESVHVKLLWENPESGKTSDVTIAQHNAVFLNADGTITVVTSGLVGRDTIPGEGIVVGDIGRFSLTFDPETGEVLDFEVLAGSHHTEGPFPELCEFLA